MENKNVSSKKSVGGVLLDILTIGMLFASFAALYLSGFVFRNKSFPLGALCAITAIGLLLLFFIGTVSCLSSKVKNKSLSVGFLAFSAAQLVALIVNLTLLFCLMIGLFTVEDLFSRLTYIITTALVLVGYVASIGYFSDGNVADDSYAADDDDDEDEEEVSVESTEMTDEPEAIEESDEPEAIEESDEPEAIEESDEPEAPEESDEPEAPEESDEPEVLEESEKAETIEISDSTEITELTEEPVEALFDEEAGITGNL